MLGLSTSTSASSGITGLVAERVFELLGQDDVSATITGALVLELLPTSARTIVPSASVSADTATTLTLDFSG